MGKKRKQEDYDEDEIIQAIVVCEPYGWNDPKTWDINDRRRNDNGMYVFVEWLECIYATNGQHGQAVVEDVYSWSSRNELLVSIRKEVNLDKQLGKHLLEEMLRDPKWKGTEFYSTIFKAKYQVEDKILRSGDGWKRCTNVPKILPRDIRRHRFTTPYPTPHDASLSLHNRGYALPIPSQILNAREDVRKSKAANDVKPFVKNEDQKDHKIGVKSEDVKPSIPHDSEGSRHGSKDENQTNEGDLEREAHVKAEPVSVKIEHGNESAKEEEEMAGLFRRYYAYEMGDEYAASSTPATMTGYSTDSRLSTSQGPSASESDRPVKRVKRESS